MSTTETPSPTAQHPSPRSRWPWFVQVLVCPVLLFAAIYSQLLFFLVPGMERLDRPSTPGLTALAGVVVVATGLLTLLVAADAPASAAGLLRYEDAGSDGVPV